MKYLALTLFFISSFSTNAAFSVKVQGLEEECILDQLKGSRTYKCFLEADPSVSHEKTGLLLTFDGKEFFSHKISMCNEEFKSETSAPLLQISGEEAEILPLHCGQSVRVTKHPLLLQDDIFKGKFSFMVDESITIKPAKSCVLTSILSSVIVKPLSSDAPILLELDADFSRERGKIERFLFVNVKNLTFTLSLFDGLSLYGQGLYFRDHPTEDDNFERALQCFEEALKSEPENVKIMHNLGSIYHKKNDLIKAKIWFEKAAKLGFEASRRTLEKLFSLS
ncbi:MAG TPA: tetratricopeptide repeat protein [Alphaproteobacteria bacterium]|nr:tetratricopeptide repeat protein [Alphaproteobacteria bacterium]HQS94760.1 tetratricopeptide repeat protein [Alphaproteobacteria bacterium]